MQSNDFKNNFPDEDSDNEDQINSATAKTAMNDPLAAVAGSEAVGHVPTQNTNKNHSELNCKIVGLTAEISNYIEK